MNFPARRSVLILYKAIAAIALLFFLLLPDAPAHAGTYTWTDSQTGQFSPTYSGGTFTANGGTSHDDIAGGGGANGNWSGDPAMPPLSGGMSCAGAITATFTWRPDDPNNPSADPPPTQVIFVKTTQAKASTISGSLAGLGTISCDTGLGTQKTDAPVTQQNGLPSKNITLTDTGYEAKAGGPTVSVTCTPTASLSGTGGGAGTQASPYISGMGGGNVRFTATVSAVKIDFGNSTTLDTNKKDNILVGQHCIASLGNIPTGCTVSNYQWSVSGTTFQHWYPSTPAGNALGLPANPNATYEETALLSTVASPSWYWKDALAPGASKPETVSCTATVTPPDGQGSSFTVTATKQVTVWVPYWSASGTAFSMRVSQNFPNSNNPNIKSTDYVLWGSMNFNASVSSPNTALFGDGTLQLVQTIAPNLSYKLSSSPVAATYVSSNNGQKGTDGPAYYGWVNTSPYQSGDAPGLDLTSTGAYSASIQDSFTDYLMYQPPGSTQYVTLAHLTWSMNGNATIPSSNNWADYSSSPGKVSPSGTTPFTASTTFPSWTQIVIPGPFHIQ